MIDRIINDINKALDAEAYMAALALVLTLPDICGKVAYGETLRNKERYIKWYEDNIGKYEKSPNDNSKLKDTYLSGEVIYQLRCSVLHQGNPNIDKDKVQDFECKIDSFEIVVEKRNAFELYSDSKRKYIQKVNGILSFYSIKYRMNLRRVCGIITAVAKSYWEENKEKFNFFNYKIIDGDKEREDLESKYGNNDV